jgi:hypothetical protein
VTVVDALAVPPDPVHERPKVLVPVNAPVDWVPEVALVPDQAPEAEQEVMFGKDQMSNDGSPLVTSAGIAASGAVDIPGTGCVPGTVELPEPAEVAVVAPPPQAVTARASRGVSSNVFIRNIGILIP